MNKLIIHILLLTVIFASCSSNSKQNNPTISPPTASPSSTLIPQPSHTPSPLPQPTSSATPSPAPTETQDPIRALLAELVNSSDWPISDLPESLVQEWQASLSGEQQLSEDTTKILKSFLEEWKRWSTNRAGISNTPDQNIVLKVRMIEDLDEISKPVIYAIDPKTSESPGGEQIYLIQHPVDSPITGLMLALTLEGFKQQISPDGQFVQYVSTTDRVVLLAEAQYIVKYKDEKLFNILSRYYPKNKPHSAFPRYRFPMAGMEASFYYLERELNSTQIISLFETLSLFQRPKLDELIPVILGADRRYLILEELKNAAGSEYANIIRLNRKDLFGDNITLAGVISHEAAHTIQPSPMLCRGEIGLGLIPNGFFDWNAAQLLEALKKMEIGSVHFELWVLYRLGASQDLIDWHRQQIQAKGRGFWDYCQ